MGLMRRVESRVEDVVSAGTGKTASNRSGRARSGKGSKLHVQPAELARKLVKEMEDHKVSGATRVVVCNQYTIYLCRADHQRLMSREREVLAGLERHLAKHAQARRYETHGEIVVTMVMDPDLASGYFGILAERAGQARVEGRETPRTTGMRPTSATVAMPAKPGPGGPVRPVGRPMGSAGGTTKVILPEEAAQLDLAHQTIVLKAGNRVREFSHGRVIVGRGRDADFRVDDPNVSRRHAALYWEDGDIMVEDLDSTNGTMVNGRSVTVTVVRPGDVLEVGECRIKIETR